MKDIRSQPSALHSLWFTAMALANFWTPFPGLGRPSSSLCTRRPHSFMNFHIETIKIYITLFQYCFNQIFSNNTYNP